MVAQNAQQQAWDDKESGGDAVLSDIENQIASVIGELDFAQAIESISPTLDLYEAGMSSHTSVKLMLAVEDLFDIEFPDEMLERETFASVANIAAAVKDVLSSD